MRKRVLSGSTGVLCLLLGLAGCTNQFYNPETKENEEVHSKILGKKEKDYNEKGYVGKNLNHLEIYDNEETQSIIRSLIKEAF